MLRDWVFEIGTEELPPHESPRLAAQLHEAAEIALRDARLAHEAVAVYYTPRRLTLYVKGLAEAQRESVETVRGPSQDVGFDADGEPTQAAQGFAQSHGARVEDLVVRETERGPYLFLEKTTPGRPTPDVLGELAPDLVDALAPSETMRWDDSGIRFIRPIRWMVALYGDEPIPTQLGRLQAGTVTRGHRLLGAQEIEVASVSDYFAKLELHGVVLDQQARRDRISEELDRIGQKIKAHPVISDELKAEIADNLEHPWPVLGQFPERYLELPREVLESTLVEHQLFVPFKVGERASPYFVGFRDGSHGDDEPVRRGYERVVHARLDDSAFFFQEDRQRTLAETADGLSQVVYQESLGTIRDKVERMRRIAQMLAERLDGSDQADQAEALDRAVSLSKADLLTQMVGEFPDLEGIMGGIYARLDGEPEPVWRGIYEHYRPKAAHDAIPTTQVGIVTSLADKLDTVVGSLLVGEEPTGSRDPFGIRRKANGIIRILVEAELDLDLAAMLEELDPLFAFLSERAPRDRVTAFLHRRLERELRERYRIPHDLARAVQSADTLNPYRAWACAQALAERRHDPSLIRLVQAYNRVANITRDRHAQAFTPQHLQDDAEQRLWREALKAEGQIAQRRDSADYDGILDRLMALQPAIDAFFEDVLVMDSDPLVRENRLALLTWVRGLFGAVGDLGQIVVEDAEAQQADAHS